MEIKNLKVNNKFYGVKATLIGASLGTVMFLGAVELASAVVCHKFVPVIRDNNIIKEHKVISQVYSKDGEQTITDYSVSNEQSKLYGMKFYNDKKKSDDYSFWNVSNLSEDKLNHIYSYINKANKYDLEDIRKFLTDNASKISESSNALKEKYFTSDDDYELKFIESKDDYNDIRIISGSNDDMDNVLNFMAGSFTLVGCGMGTFYGHLHGKQKKKEMNK